MLTEMRLSGRLFSDCTITILGIPAPPPLRVQPAVGDMKLVCLGGIFHVDVHDGERWHSLVDNGNLTLLPDHPLCINFQDKAEMLPLAVQRCNSLNGRLVLRDGGRFIVDAECA